MATTTTVATVPPYAWESGVNSMARTMRRPTPRMSAQPLLTAGLRRLLDPGQPAIGAREHVVAFDVLPRVGESSAEVGGGRLPAPVQEIRCRIAGS
jgi:hypothetical protein